jgi:hypothetical protein
MPAIPNGRVSTKLLAVAIAMVGCAKGDNPSVSVGADGGPTLTVVEAGDTDLATTAQRWNSAIAQRDWTLLPQLYATMVDYHGVPLRRDQLVQVRRDTWTNDASFTQSIDHVAVVSPFRVEFARKWVTLGVPHTSRASLDFAREGERWVVVSESDAHADQARANPDTPPAQPCDDLVVRVVMSTVKGLALAENKSRNQIQITARPPEAPMYSVAVIGNDAHVRATLGWFDVFPSTGRVSDAFSGDTLLADADLVGQVRKCDQR